ncbi:MAG: 50S ribosomal protein L11 methyltransferase [Alphaproteobacteria bacterium]
MVPQSVAPAFVDAVGGDALGADAVGADALAISSFELPGGANWTIEILLTGPVDRAAWEVRLRRAAAGLDMAPPRLTLLPLPPLAERDWVARSLRAQPPVRAGRFFVHGAHDRGRALGRALGGAVTLEVDAGRAFGNGRHETTFGCLLALDHVAKVRRYERPLDLGCGAGLLALAMAKLWRVPVGASDIDPWAVAVANRNARANHLHPWVRAVLSDGFAHRALSAGAPYDLIIANILARPLQRLAPAIAARLAPGGRVILSGLLAKQDAQVRAAYLAQGLHLVHRWPVGGWLTLELTR